MSIRSTAGSVPAEAGHAARRAANSGALDKLARIGFLAKGLIYALVGVLAIQVAFGDPEEADQQGALHAVAQQPLGAVVLWVMVAGLAGYALWRLSQAIWGVHGESDEKQAQCQAADSARRWSDLRSDRRARAPHGHGGFASGSDQQTAVAKVLDWPGGEALVIAAGVVVVGVGLGRRSTGCAPISMRTSTRARWGRRRSSSRASSGS